MIGVAEVVYVRASYPNHGKRARWGGENRPRFRGEAVARRYASRAGSPWLALARPRPQYALGDI